MTTKNEIKSTDRDPISFLTKQEREIMGEAVAGMTTSQIIELRGQAQVLKNKYRTHAFKTNAISTTIFENATMTKIDILSTQKSVQGINHIAKKAAAEGAKEGRNLLEKFAMNHYGDSMIRNAPGLNPISSINKYYEFEKAKPNSVRIAETIIQNQEQFDRLQQRVGTTTPDPANKPIYDLEEGYLGNFKNEEAARQLLKACIPCDFRKFGKFTATFSDPWQDTIDQLTKKWKELLRMLRDLSTFKPGEFSMDLCNLFKFLDGQCIPDITGLMSLLSLMQLKYLDLGGTSLGNITAQLVAPLLTPIIASFTSNLDQYADIIIGPLKCVTAALEKQMINLQEQVNGAINIGDQNTRKYRENEIKFLDAKIKSLRNRKLQLNIEKKNRSIRDSGGTNADIKLDGNVLTPSPYPAYSKGTSADYTREEKIIKTKLVNGGIRIAGANKETENGVTPQLGIQVTIKEEEDIINQHIKSAELKKQNIRKKLEENTSYKPINFNDGLSMTRATQDALNNMQISYKSQISELTEAVNDGINVVQQSIDIYRQEFQRLVMGRVTTQQDQIEYAKLLQKIARLGAIVKSVSDFKKVGLNLKKFCERGAENALAQVAKGIKENDDQSMFDFYQAQDGEGNPLILIAPGGATVNVSSVEFNEISDDALFADAVFDLDAVTKTVSFNDLNEVDKMNREGIVPNLGNIDSKKIELSNNLKVGSELDLHYKTSYAIISNEFCSKSAISFGSSDTVKQWAASLWQKE